MRLILVILLVVASSVSAQVKTWSVSGTIANTTNTGDAFAIGQRWSATFSVDYSAPVGDSGTNFAGYQSASQSLTFSTAGYEFSSPSSTAWFYVYNDNVFGTSADLLETSFHSPSGPALNGKTPSLFQFLLRDSSMSSIEGVGLPGGVDLSTWSNEDPSYFYWGTGPSRSELILTVDTVAIPEPATYAGITAFAVFAIVLIKRRRA